MIAAYLRNDLEADANTAGYVGNRRRIRGRRRSVIPAEIRVGET
jgi:hypothetical protein